MSYSLAYQNRIKLLVKSCLGWFDPFWSNLWLVVLIVQLVNASSSIENEKCIDFELKKIDAITTWTNGSLFLVHGDWFWILEKDQVPLKSTAQPVSNLFAEQVLKQFGFQDESNRTIFVDDTHHHPHRNHQNETMNAQQKRLPFTINAAVNVQLKAVNGQCLPTNQIILYSKLKANRSLITLIENNGQSYSTTNVSHFEVLRAAKSIDWSKPIDGLTFFNNITVVFQNQHFTSIRCHEGKWTEVLHKEFASVFPGVYQLSVDSVLIRNNHNQPFDMSYLLMFYGHEYFECPTTGNDPCEGPYNVLSEFFKIDQFCPNMMTMIKSGRLLNFMTVFITIVVIVFVLLVFLLVLYFILKPEHFTYFVNGKIGSNSNYSREHLSYEALKIQNDIQSGGVECKNVNNGKNGANNGTGQA